MPLITSLLFSSCPVISLHGSELIMETLPYRQTNDAKPFMEASDGKSFSLPQQVADPVVYKLVRVEGDGRLIPATNDELMEVEDLLEDEKGELSLNEDLGDLKACVINDLVSSRTADPDASEGSQESEVDAENLKYIGEMLQKVNEEERLRLSCGSFDNLSKRLGVEGLHSNWKIQSPARDEKHRNDYYVPEFSSCSKKDCNSQMRGIETSLERTNMRDEQSVSDSTSMMAGDVCLDRLSLRELQETFKATFGRETSVKDKVWLKRRIAMGLTNTYDIPTNFIIRGRTIVTKEVQKESNASSLPGDFGVSIKDICRNNSATADKMENQDPFSCERLKEERKHEELNNEDIQVVQVATKRVRKPTRRYIEELSVTETRECSGSSNSSVKHSGHIPFASKSQVGYARGEHSAVGLVSWHDSLSGSDVQIPHVPRIRRARPRQNCMALVWQKYEPNGVAAKVVKQTLGVQISRKEGHDGSKTWCTEAYSDPIQQAASENLDHVTEREKHMSVTPTRRSQEGVDVYQLPGEERTDGNGNVVTVPTAKGGIRRKHHRAWTLGEVVKLVDGVSRYGAGRWSEIKRVSFASYAYRTSVDLKDKWRNLLKASFSQESLGGVVHNSRKQASIPIPAPILIRVRELAEMHAQTPPKPKLVGGPTNNSDVSSRGSWKSILQGSKKIQMPVYIGASVWTYTALFSSSEGIEEPACTKIA